ncbi:MAG: ATP synthase F1 subunit gamma [Deltaproteobacteria bacterium]|nr:ATP synthase F1 subunit gamma [Deltaproteobacteria bacterium]
MKNTQKITKAMKMVAAAKLRRAQQAATHARAYVAAVEVTAGRLVRAWRDDPHPLTVAKGKPGKKEFLILTSDRGLCGGFNSNLLRKVEETLKNCREQNIRTEARLIGKKGRDYFKAKRLEITEAATGLYENLDRKIAEELARVAIRRFEEGKTGEIWLVYNFFKSTLVQEVIFKKLLPVEDLDHGPRTTDHGLPADYILEPAGYTVLDKMLRELAVSRIYGGLLESVASELAARMAAMDNATKNASDMIGYLTLVFNRARQAAITKELMDIVGGAEALR